MTARLVPLSRVRNSIPLSLGSLYNARRDGRLPWLQRLGPEGRRGRKLWVDLDELAAWARLRGWKLDLARLEHQP